MLNNQIEFDEKELLNWIKKSVESNTNVFSQGYQSRVYLYKAEDGSSFIIKAPMGSWLGKYICRIMLRREFKVYSNLPQLKGIPRCFGIIDGSYLLLEFIDGPTVRRAEINDRKFFFKTLLTLIKQLHDAGVAHADLKQKDNILVVQGKVPYVIDFGVAVIKKQGFAPLNNYLYNTAIKFDFNAWVKLKYDAKYKDVSEEDSQYFDRTRIEKAARLIKDNYLIIKRIFIDKRKVSG